MLETLLKTVGKLLGISTDISYYVFVKKYIGQNKIKKLPKIANYLFKKDPAIHIVLLQVYIFTRFTSTVREKKIENSQ